MANVISLLGRKKAKTEKTAAPNARTVKLWNFSLDVDDLVTKAVSQSGLSPDEVASVLAHRLGTLIGCCEHPTELNEFCVHIIQRLQKERQHKKGA
jgi:hypothetical protein